MNKSFLKSKKSELTKKSDIFQFKFNLSANQYVGEMYENTNSYDNKIEEYSYPSYFNDRTIFDASFISEIKSMREKFQEKQNVDEDGKTEQLINYGQGIRHYRLIKNTLIDNEKFIEDEALFDEDDEENENKDELRKMQMDEDLDEDDDENEGKLDNLIKSQKQLNTELSKKDDTSATKFLKRLSFIMMVVIMVLSILGFYFKINNVYKVKEYVKIIEYSSKQMSLIQYITLYSRNLMFLNNGSLMHTNTTAEKKAFELKMRQGIENSLQEFDQINEEIQFSSFYKIASNTIVPMYFRENNDYSHYDLNQASEQIITKAYYIRNMPLEEITYARSKVNFVLYNSMNDYFLILKNNFSTLMTDMASMNEQIFTIAVIFLATSISIICSLSLMNTFFFQKAYKIKVQILSVFLEIPQKTAKFLYSKCENFLVNISSGDGDDFMFNDFENTEDMKNHNSNLNETNATNNSDFFGKTMKKKFKNHEKKYIGFFLRLVLVVLTIVGYYLIDFFTGKIYTDKLTTLMKEFNATFFCESYFALVVNIEKLMFFDEKMPVLKEQSYNYLRDNYEKVYEIEASIMKEHAFNRASHDPTYVDAFDLLKSVGPCQLIGNDGLGSVEECKDFAHGNVNEVF